MAVAAVQQLTIKTAMVELPVVVGLLVLAAAVVLAAAAQAVREI
jgi:hypothetical protein